LKSLLECIEASYTEPSRGLLAIPLVPGLLRQLSDRLPGILSPAELQDTRSLIIEIGGTIKLADLASMQPLGILLARSCEGWLSDLIRDGRLTSHFQPIVHALNPQVVFAYECLLRGIDVDGMLITPARMYRAARESDLLFSLDRSARLSAIREAAGFGLDTSDVRIFINFNPSSIYDPAYCLRSTIAAISSTVFDPSRIVFEIVESDHIEDIKHLTRIVGYYRDAGFRVALDDLGAGYGSLHLLSELRPNFVKLDMQLIRGVDRDPYKAGIVCKLLEMAQTLGIEAVAEGIETEEEWVWLREHGADYVQGFYFAEPDPVPPRPRSDKTVSSVTRPMVDVT
jgi:EAL domain-containing protein (putative c-di-GMP-specific phosphodiesterase class I)